MVLHLIMPEIYEEITVKVIDLAYVKGEDVYAPVILWGDPKAYRFEMKITKTVWHGIYKYLKEMEDDPLNKMVPEEAQFKIDEQLSFLKDRILTIRGVPDESRSFVAKSGKVEFAKIFRVKFEVDLEDAERGGKDAYKEAVFKYVIDNYSSKDCRLANTAEARNAEIKKENKEKEKEEKKKEKESKFAEKKLDKKKRGNNEKKITKVKELDNCGWS